MARLGARQVALRVLRRVDEGAYVNLALDGECTRAQLASNDRRLATALVYGVLKGQARLDHALASCAPRGLDGLDPQTRDLLRLGALQILELRTPAHAAVDETVDSLRKLRGAKLAGFGNALLRRLSRDGAPDPPSAPPSLRLSVQTGAPRWVVDAAIARLGEVEAEALLGAEGRPAPLWLRVNPLRVTEAERADLIARLRATESQIVRGALRLESGEGLFDSADYTGGLVTVQDLGAQLVGSLVDAQPGEAVLDACAGVGGKTTQLVERMANRGRVDAVDRSARKLELGADHARRLGLSIVRSIEGDVTASLPGLQAHYDRVLVDAPCSGLGVARRHPEVRLRRDPAELAELVRLQAQLLDAGAERVRPGGVLVYAVCTYTEEEGPAQIAAFLERRPDFERADESCLPAALRGRGAAGELRTWPHRDDADAFFASRLHRRA